MYPTYIQTHTYTHTFYVVPLKWVRTCNSPYTWANTRLLLSLSTSRATPFSVPPLQPNPPTLLHTHPLPLSLSLFRTSQLQKEALRSSSPSSLSHDQMPTHMSHKHTSTHTPNTHRPTTQPSPLSTQPCPRQIPPPTHTCMHAIHTYMQRTWASSCCVRRGQAPMRKGVDPFRTRACARST